MVDASWREPTWTYTSLHRCRRFLGADSGVECLVLARAKRTAGQRSLGWLWGWGSVAHSDVFDAERNPRARGHDYRGVPRITLWFVLLACACSGGSPWDPAVDETLPGAQDPLDPSMLPFDIAAITGDGARPTHALGSTLAAIGDFDGDGFPDVASGVTYEDILVAFGGDRPPARASDLRAGINGVQIVPETDSWFTIGDIAGSGDFNGDGHDDLIVGLKQVEIAPTQFTNRAYVLFGGARPSEPLRLAEVAQGRGGSMLEGFGVWGVSGVGDVDGDGYHDVALTGPTALHNDEEGVIFVVRGRPGSSVVRRDRFSEGDDGFTIRAAHPDLLFHRADPCGDVDGDGHDDLLVSGYRVLADEDDQRIVFVLYGDGAPGSVVLDEEGLDASTSVIVGETKSHDHFLGPTPQCGDFDGNGRADLLFGDSVNDQAVVVLEVRRGDRISLDDVGSRVRGFRVRPVEDSFEGAEVVLPLPDLDGDGRDDFMVEMRTFDGQTQHNWALFVFGRHDQGTIDAADIIAGEGGFAFVERWDEDARAMVSRAVAPGDFDGNGLPDVAFGDTAFFADQVYGRVRLLLFDEPVGDERRGDSE